MQADSVEEIEWVVRVPHISLLFEKLGPYASARVLSLNIGRQSPEARLSQSRGALTLQSLPNILGLRCPLLRRLRVVYRSNCSLWEFADHLVGIFQLHQFTVYEFVWRGGTCGIEGFMGNYFTAFEERSEAIRRLQEWAVWAGELVGATKVSLEGVKCVCEDPLKTVECPDADACKELAGFFEKCKTLGFSVGRY